MKQQHYGVTKDGQEVGVYTMASGSGLRVNSLTFGCIGAASEAPHRRGQSTNIVLGLGSLSDYAYVSPHFGAIAERYAIRIARGRFAIDGVEYRLENEAGPNAAGSGESLALGYLSPDGEASPGNLAVTFGLGAANELRIDYAATTDKPTIINLTNHSHFNLAGEGSGNFPGHVVSIECSKLDLRTHSRRCRR